jgi:hypothetical protein
MRQDVRRRPRSRWGVVTGAVLAASQGGVGLAYGQVPAVSVPATVVSADRVVRMNPAELEQLYRLAGPGQVPRGAVRGIPIVAPGRPYAPAASRAGRVVWQGKVFNDDGSAAVNRFFGVRAVRGSLSYGPSWLDGRPSVILDYQGTSLVYGRYRDEIREVAPGLYLGVMYARAQPQPTFTRFFAFEARP